MGISGGKSQKVGLKYSDNGGISIWEKLILVENALVAALDIKANLYLTTTISKIPHGWTFILSKYSVDPCFPLC